MHFTVTNTPSLSLYCFVASTEEGPKQQIPHLFLCICYVQEKKAGKRTGNSRSTVSFRSSSVTTLESLKTPQFGQKEGITKRSTSYSRKESW